MSLSFADEQIVISKGENSLQRALYSPVLHWIAGSCNVGTSINKTKILAFQDKTP